jgi:tetratricopeptide (TPR) repeat protein
MYRLQIIIAATVLAVSGAQAFAASDAMEKPRPVPVMAQAENWQQDMDLRRWKPEAFHDDFTHAVAALSAAHGNKGADVLLDTAELYLAHMLVDEARQILAGSVPETPQQHRRHTTLTQAADLLAGKKVDGFAGSPLMDAKRPDSAFWASLQAIAAADVPLLTANIKSSFQGLTYQSRAVLRAMLPVFTEAAIETRHMGHAQSALGLLDELPDLVDAPVGYFLRGRAAEVKGNQPAALEAYFQASQGWDQYAARARLAVADMSLANGSRGALLAAQNTLSAGAEAWRGNRYELELLKRLARVYVGLNNDVEALLILGKLIKRFPDTQEARVAKTQSIELLEAFYRKGAEGKLPLGTWLEVHLQLLPYYRQQKEFARHTEELGDFVLGLSATDLAAREYRRAMSLVRDPNVDIAKGQRSHDLFRLHMKLAKSQMRAGLTAEARITLELTAPPENETERDAFAAFEADVLAELGDNPAFLKTDVTLPSAEHLRSLGMILTQEQRWGSAADVFQQLWDKHPQEFSVTDATHLLIAANRADHMNSMDSVLQAFPSLTESKPLIKLAESLNSEMPALLPLRADTAKERLQTLQDAFESIKDSGISP